MMKAPPVGPGVQLKLAVVLVMPDWILTRLVGALGTTGMNIVDPVPAAEGSEEPIAFFATILAYT